MVYYRIEVQDLAHGIKRWGKMVGFANQDLNRLRNEIQFLRAAAKLRGQTRGNKYRLVRVDGDKEEVLSE